MSDKRALVRRTCQGMALVSMGLASTAALADKSPALDRFSLWLGGYYANADTDLGANYRHLARGTVNFEDDLKFPDHKTVPRVRFDFLIGDSQGFSFDYYRLDRSHSRTLSDGINFGDRYFGASATVRGRLDFDFGSAAYRWWFGHENDVFGLGIGAAYYRVRAGVSGDASINGDTVGYASTRYNDSAWAPMLQFGWRHAFSDSLRIYADASGVKKNGGSLNGSIYNADVGVEWFPWHNVGVGAEYDFSRIQLHKNSHTYDANLDMKLNGPSLFLRFRF